MGDIIVFGHKNPDTDTICSAIVMANLQTKLGKKVKAVRLGEINKETEFVLNNFGIEKPEMIESIEEGQEVILVDHNEFSQSVSGIEGAKIKMVVDHHRINDFKTSEPLHFYSEPVGCTNTVLYKLYKMNNIEIEEKIAGLMLSAIVSDTLLLKSPTCTDEDKKAVEELAKIANVNIEKYGIEMLKAGTDLDDFSEEELISLDAKKSEKNDVKYIIAQVNTVSIEDVFKRQEKLEMVISKQINEMGLNLFVFVVTDILENNSEILVLGNRKDIVEKTYKLERNRVFLPGVVSRKKQILPFVESNID